MIIHSLSMSNYRNYDIVHLDFDKETNILYGDNAQGKTNILEAIYLSSTTKSHRGSKDKDIIQMGQNESHIRMELDKKGIPGRIDMHLRKNKGKGIAINGVPIRKASELLGLSNVVFFSPEDLNIIKNGPSERRRFIDMELSQIDPVYLYNLTKYKKILIQRNSLLKQIRMKPKLSDTLSIWNEQLVEYGSQIIISRQEMVEEIYDIARKIHKRLTGEKEKLTMYYEPNVSINEYASKLEKSFTRDVDYKTTHVGPHRDDISFQINDKDIRTFGSQGQQRTTALSLKLAELELIKKKKKDKPVLLLDDVLSELDRNRQNYLLDGIKGIQTLITCTGLEEFVQNRLKINNIYKIVNGTVIHENKID